MRKATAATSSVRPGRACALRISTDKPIVTGRLAMGAGKPAVDLARVDDRTLESTITVNEDGAYRVALADADGLTSEGMEYFIRADGRSARQRFTSCGRSATRASRRSKRSRSRPARTTITGSRASSWCTRLRGGKEKVVPFTSLGGTNMARIGSRMLAAEDLQRQAWRCRQPITRGRATLPAANRRRSRGARSSSSR